VKYATPVDVLLVEDCAGDALLTRQMLAESPVRVKLHIARDGAQALQLLEGATFRPSLVILDLNLPEVSGLQVLKRYRSPGIPIVVFSGSSSETDRHSALALGASEYVCKPTDLQAFREAVWDIVEKWALEKG